MQDKGNSILNVAINNLYKVFSCYKAPRQVVDYPCISCFDKTDEQDLLTNPLRELNDHIFGLLFESCNVFPFGDEIYKYFVPRVLELITIEKPQFSFQFVEHVHRDFAKFDYQNKFLPREIRAIDDFFKAWLQQEFNKPSDEYDEAELFYAAEAGYNTVLFLKRMTIDRTSSHMFKHLKNYITVQEKHKSKDEFKKWTTIGTVNQLIQQIYNEDKH